MEEQKPAGVFADDEETSRDEAMPTPKGESMSREAQTIWIVAAIAVVGLILFLGFQANETAKQNRARAALQAEYDAAIRDMNSVNFTAPPLPGTNLGPAQEQNMRQMTELLELSCRQSGQNCETAKLLRRQYNERNGIQP